MFIRIKTSLAGGTHRNVVDCAFFNLHPTRWDSNSLLSQYSCIHDVAPGRDVLRINARGSNDQQWNNCGELHFCFVNKRDTAKGSWKYTLWYLNWSGNIFFRDIYIATQTTRSRSIDYQFEGVSSRYRMNVSNLIKRDCSCLKKSRSYWLTDWRIDQREMFRYRTNSNEFDENCAAEISKLFVFNLATVFSKHSRCVLLVN